MARSGPRRWSEEELARLRALYADTPNDLIAKALGRTLWTVNQRACGLGLKKSAVYITGLQRVKSWRARELAEAAHAASALPPFGSYGLGLYLPTGTLIERAGRVEAFRVDGQRTSRAKPFQGRSWNRGKHRGPGIRI